jgi:hypothetical protein
VRPAEIKLAGRRHGSREDADKIRVHLSDVNRNLGNGSTSNPTRTALPLTHLEIIVRPTVLSMLMSFWGKTFHTYIYCSPIKELETGSVIL